LYECEICSLKLWEEYWMRVLKKVPREMFGPKWEKVT
jgi:hypothetical protein